MDFIKSKKQMFIVISVFALVMMLGTVTYAFFNYTRTGAINNLGTGRINFNSSQNGTVNLTNMFPMASTQAESASLDSVTVAIQGDTTYVDGEEFQITLVDVINTINGKTIPINYIATYTANTDAVIGTSSSDYWNARNNKDASIYTLESTGSVEEGKQVLVGYIDNGTTGINGTLTIKAYIDVDKIAITDTPEENTEWQQGRTVFTTTEWNSFSSTPLSFKIRAESNEGIWVEEEATPASCFDYQIIKMYNLNRNMTTGELNTCISYITSLNWDWQSGETVENYCAGTGTRYGKTFQVNLDIGREDANLAYLVEHNIIIPEYAIEMSSYDQSCGTDIVIPNKINASLKIHNISLTNEEIGICVNYLTEYWGEEQEGQSVDVGETYESFCDGTGTIWGKTFQQALDANWFYGEQINYLKNNNIIVDGEAHDYPVYKIDRYFISNYLNVNDHGITTLKFNNNLRIVDDTAIISGNSNIIPKEIIIPESVTYIGSQAFQFGSPYPRELYDGTTFIILGNPFIDVYSIPAYETIRYNGLCSDIYNRSIIYNPDNYYNLWNVITADTDTCEVYDGNQG